MEEVQVPTRITNDDPFHDPEAAKHRAERAPGEVLGDRLWSRDTEDLHLEIPARRSELPRERGL
ncbi:hypothetical protein GCM10009592_32340 [Brachybacterium rhamnosum]|uniref:Uncharacterized protein n=1 Tax=Brachybacterium rhamnosum TaxID=173361 RepID=A0ABW4Q2Y5_9MICO